MTDYKCNVCLKKFNKKSNYEYHIYRKIKSCQSQNIDETMEDDISNYIEEIKLTQSIVDDIICEFCKKKFSRMDNLERHIMNNCKNIKEEDEKDLKINMLMKEISSLKDLILTTGNINNNSNNNITNNIQSNNNIQTNNTNVQVNINGFGKEIIENIDILEAMKVFLKSTGGNIIPNMLKHINMNMKYPQNHNICITDFAREIVRINDGNKCIFKKFKNAKYDIIHSVSNNINNILDIYKDNYKRNDDIDNKIELNTISIRLINGEEITDDSDEEEETTDKLSENNPIDDNTKSKSKKNELIVETKEQVEESIKNMIEKREKDKKNPKKIKKRLNINHLNSKREGLQKLTFEKLKEELYNGKKLIPEI